MRIALNMLFVTPTLAGGRVYCEELLRALAAIDQENEYVVYTRKDVELPKPLGERFQQVRAPVSASSTLWRAFWEYGILPWHVRRGRFDVFHGLGTVSPTPRSRALVLTVHDLTFRHFPDTLPRGHRWFIEGVLPRVARRADRIIVPSQYTAREVVKYLDVRPQRLRLVPYGPGNALHPVADGETLQQTLSRHGVRQPYIISVCRAYAHKNLAGLIRAFAWLRSRGQCDGQLVLVGDRYRAGKTLTALVDDLRLREAVVFTGRVSDEELSALYSGGAVFAFPSLAEGLGLPPLEAMACGVPVVASNATAIPEAVGSAGVLVDARDPAALGSALEALLRDAKLQQLLRSKGLERVREFTWERCARQTLAVYEELR